MLLIAAVFVFLISSKINSKECSSLSDLEAKAMISRIFVHKLERSKDGLIIFDINPKGYIDIEYLDQQKNNVILIASIYDNCEVQWVNGH
jgi:DNA polymerase III alpha subunit (gram-positive type)